MTRDSTLPWNCRCIQAMRARRRGSFRWRTGSSRMRASTCSNCYKNAAGEGVEHVRAPAAPALARVSAEGVALVGPNQNQRGALCSTIVTSLQPGTRARHQHATCTPTHNTQQPHLPVTVLMERGGAASAPALAPCVQQAVGVASKPGAKESCELLRLALVCNATQQHAAADGISCCCSSSSNGDGSRNRSGRGSSGRCSSGAGAGTGSGTT